LWYTEGGGETMKKEQITLEEFYQIKLIHLKGTVPLSFWEDAPHSHDHCEIFIHIKGTLDIFVEKNLYHLNGNEIRLYRSGELHCGRADTEQDMEWYQISIPHRFFLEAAYAPLAPILFDREAGCDNVFATSRQEELLEALTEVFDAYANHTPLFSLYGQSAVLRLLCLLNEPCRNRTVTEHQDQVLQQIIDRINTDFQSILGLGDLCRITHYSPSYLHRLFRSKLNVTPYQFLLGKKLNEAKKSLWQGDTVTEACDHAGFNNYNNFITLFKKTFGITPNKYREQYRLRS